VREAQQDVAERRGRALPAAQGEGSGRRAGRRQVAARVLFYVAAVARWEPRG
jgi:hypothetical protein